jgi:L-lactate dehydrogenase
MLLGERGDSEFPLWSQARIGPVPLDHWDAGDGPLPREELDRIADDVKNAAYTVIAGKGATNYAIGLSSARIVEAILHDEHAVMPVSTVLEDYHGISGVALSVPSIVSASGAVPIRETAYSEREFELLRHSAQSLRGVADSLR